MEPTSILIGLAIGAVAAYVIANMTIKKNSSKAADEATRQSELIIQEARLSAKRTEDEAALKADKIISKAEAENERIKQQKIQEAKERYAQMKQEVEAEKMKRQLELKDLEMEIAAQQKDIKVETDAINARFTELEARKNEMELKELELDTLRENLDKQLKIVQKKREELDAANEERIKALESIARLTQQDAKDQLLEQVRAKSESEAQSIVRDAIGQAKLNANKEAKKIVIQTIQRMAAEFTIENTVSVFNL
ncbi:MAG: Rnase Y domain-containing protein, partial [Bacteroidota bacterium]